VNIAVCIKQVPDSETRPKIKKNYAEIDTEGVKWIVNPYDEYAIEEALQLTEKFGGEVCIISLGPKEIEPTIRAALAMGAKKAIRIESSSIPQDPLVIAKALAEILKDQNFDLIFFGKQAIDDDNAQIPQFVGEALQLPCATVVISVSVESNRITVEREIEGSKEKISFELPGIISAQKGLNEPRYRSLRGIMMAKKIPIEVKNIALGKDNIVIKKLTLPPTKPPGKIVGEGKEAVPELVRLLHEEAKLI
jgi:electron transfer flavoprotein beta subunit